MTDSSNAPYDPCSELPDPDPCNQVGDPDVITPDEVKCAQQQWCDGLIRISRLYQANPDGNEYREEAIKFLNDLYDFGDGGRVFFRPTLALFPFNFRTDFQGTLDYFIGDRRGDGFAKKKLKSATYSNKIAGRDGEPGIRIHGNTAMAVGNVCLEEEGVPGKTVVDKVFVYRKVGNDLKLMVHMSALRNDPGKPAFE